MAVAFGSKARFDDLRLSARVFLANKSAVAGLVIFLGFLIVGLLVTLTPGLMGIQDPGVFVSNAFINANVANCSGAWPEPPSAAHWFGTTEYQGAGGFGCIDLFNLILKAIPVDLALSFFIVLIGAGIGTVIGILAGYMGRYVDEGLMRLTDIFFGIPFLVLAIAVGFVIGRTLLNMAVALMIVWWPLYARYGRSLTLSTKEMAFVESATAAGSGRWKILFKHILPNVLPPIFIQISLDVGTVVGIFSALAFIGFLPTDANLPELGYITNQGLTLAPLGYWWTVVFPGATITLFALAVNLMGDGFRDVIDPRRRS